MTDPDELGATLVAIRDAMTSLGIRWAVGGSLASAAYGEPRATNDVDIIAALDSARARRLGQLLGDDFYFSEEAALDAVEHNDSFNVIDQRSFIKVDIFVPAAGPLGRGQLDRARDLALGASVVVPTLGPEDVVLQKLRWYELTGRSSDRQWRDLVAVLRAADLDDDYLDRVAGTAGLTKLLAAARTDAS